MLVGRMAFILPGGGDMSVAVQLFFFVFRHVGSTRSRKSLGVTIVCSNHECSSATNSYGLNVLRNQGSYRSLSSCHTTLGCSNLFVGGVWCPCRRLGRAVGSVAGREVEVARLAIWSASLFFGRSSRSVSSVAWRSPGWPLLLLEQVSEEEAVS